MKSVAQSSDNHLMQGRHSGSQPTAAHCLEE